MRRTRRVALAALTAASLLATTLTAATPATAETEGCLPDVGKDVPVLFVHGLMGKPEQWGDPRDPSTTIGKIEALPGVKTSAFNYAAFATQWVTNPNIGTALANRIACMAASSRQQGGKGKVVVVAHSMGGLATRQAISESSEAAQALGMVVTIATPNTGSSFDRSALGLAETLCKTAAPLQGSGCMALIPAALQVLTALPGLATGSAELAALPDWPKRLPVYAIAGNIAPHYNLFGLQFDGPPSGTDTLVSTSSALHGNVVNGLGGTKGINCVGGPPPVLMNWTKATCEHGALVNNGDVQAQVVKTIKAFATQSTAAPVTYGGLTLSLPSGWRLQSNADEFGQRQVGLVPPGANCTVKGYWTTTCANVRLLDAKTLQAQYRFTGTDNGYKAGDPYYPAGGIMNCPGSTTLYRNSPTLQREEHMQIGGKAALHNTWQSDCIVGPNGGKAAKRLTQETWYVQSTGMLIVDDWATGIGSYLTAARWS